LCEKLDKSVNSGTMTASKSKVECWEIIESGGS